MRLSKIVAVVAALTLTVPAFAQFSNAGSKLSSSSNLCRSYNRIGVAYTNTGYTANKYEFIDDEDHLWLNGFALEYIHGFSVSKSLPMFVETGLKVNFGFGSVEGDDKDVLDGTVTPKIVAQDIYMAVPVNYAYKFGVGNVAITPYLGLNLKLHLMSRMKQKIECNGFDPDDIGLEDEDLESDWANLFSKDDMGGKDATWNRFQLGWHIGVGVDIKSFYVGLSYGTDFIKAYKYKKYGVNSGNLAVSLAYIF